MRGSYLFKKVIVFLLLVVIGLSISNFSEAATRVRGYYRKDGTYVAPHYRSDPDGSFYNNWSTKGNINPYTGEEGTKTSSNSYSYSDTYSSTGSSNSDSSNYIFDYSLLKTSECKDKHGSYSVYDSSAYACGCITGYTMSNGGTCVPFDFYCSEKYGVGGTYNGSQCTCVTGYKLDSKNKCIKLDDICKKDYGEDAYYDKEADTCSYCDDGYRLHGKLCYPVNEDQSWAVTKNKTRLYTFPETKLKYKGPLVKKDEIYYILESKTNKKWINVEVDGKNFWIIKTNVNILD